MNDDTATIYQKNVSRAQYECESWTNEMDELEGWTRRMNYYEVEHYREALNSNNNGRKSAPLVEIDSQDRGTFSKNGLTML